MTQREKPFERNPDLEELLALLESPMQTAEECLLESLTLERRPIVLICACARSGATLLLQFLARSGVFGYPSNLISRFYAAPVLGALVQKMLFDPDYQFRRELDLKSDCSDYFRSELGKTEGALSPNEFYYFWRRWFSEVQGHPPTVEDLQNTAFDEVLTELRGLSAVFGLPLAFKASLLNWTLPLVAERIPEAYIVFLRRDPLYTVQSILEARIRFFGSEDAWYSFKPPGAEALLELPAISQVAAQVVMTEEAIEDGISVIDPSRVIRISYEQLCSDPNAAWQALVDKIGEHPGCPDMGECPSKPPFRSSNVDRLPPSQLNAIRKALDDLAG